MKVLLRPIIIRGKPSSWGVLCSSRSQDTSYFHRLSELRALLLGHPSRLLHVNHFKRQHQGTTPAEPDLQLLPWSCPGCGAYTQSQIREDPGYFSLTRKPVRAFIRGQKIEHALTSHVEPMSINETVLNHGMLVSAKNKHKDIQSSIPICDRCHALQHHHKGASIIHPTLQSIRNIILESPYQSNHIYHILDAADFPLSLIPNIHHQLGISPQRSQNRRSRAEKFYHGQNNQISFIITRSDLLAPSKDQVDSMMPRLVRILREALDLAKDGIRLGNVQCVSAHRGWWTRQLKEDIWKRGGACWMVGKVNVGKSNLFDSVFPKGPNSSREKMGTSLPDHGQMLSYGGSRVVERPAKTYQGVSIRPPSLGEAQFNVNSLLPPRPIETDYPSMPLVSYLPGTTASPIRLPFGAGRGELIDLPGLERGGIENHILGEHKSSLVMKTRVKAKQYSIKPGQSLVLSNLIRITPKSPDVVFLACPFVPLEAHVTNTEKAKAILSQEIHTGVVGITNPGTGPKMASAGIFELSSEVTKARAGPLTASDAAAIVTQKLPFQIYSTDILIEGIGWVELAAQVRKKTLKLETSETPSPADHAGHPIVEVFSPAGMHIGSREALGAWLSGGRKRLPVSRRTKRPRRSMRGVKKVLKKAVRATRILDSSL